MSDIVGKISGAPRILVTHSFFKSAKNIVMTFKQLRTVRVFISSTFRDMHAERDYLVKVVFPALRERLDPHHIEVVDVDLRWGITEAQAENNRVLELCLEQIDACRPFFIGVLGQRYGWTLDAIDEHVVRKYEWIGQETGKSITELEILYGALRDSEVGRRAFFYFRDTSALSKVPETERWIYEDNDPKQLNRLNNLKKRIQDSNSKVMDGYQAQWVAKTLDRPLKSGRLDKLEAFGKRVLKDLWEAIYSELELPEIPQFEAEATSSIERELAYHMWFAERRLVGVSDDVRRDLHDVLLEYALSESSQGTPLLLVGPAGSGKSTVLSRLVLDLQKKSCRVVRNLLIVPLFVGASPRSTSLRSIIIQIIDILQAAYGGAFDSSVEMRELIPAFWQKMQEVPQSQRLVIVVDGINQFDERNEAEQLRWLPTVLPANVRILLSEVRPGTELSYGARIAARRGFQIVEVPPLRNNQLRTIIKQVPAIAAKTLDDRQLDLLLNNPATRNPLFLRVALEELRFFGSFEDLDARIRTIPHSTNVTDPVQTIFRHVLERLEEDFDAQLVRELLRLLTTARRGLAERELRSLLGEQACTGDLFPVLRHLRPYLMRRGDVIDFFHRSLWKAARTKYFSTDFEREAAHRRLASYFDAQPDFIDDDATGDSIANERRADELPYQLLEAGQNNRLAELLLSLPFLEAKAKSGYLADLAHDFSACGARVDVDSAYLLRVLERAIRHDIGFLRRHPKSLFQQLWNRGWWYDSPACADYYKAPEGYMAPWIRQRAKVSSVLEKWRRERKPTPWIRMFSPPEDLYSDNMMLDVHTCVVMHVAWATDTRLAVALGDGQVWVWDVASASGPVILTGHTATVEHVSWSPDGLHLASASHDGTVRVWDVETETTSRVLKGHQKHVLYAVWSPDGRRLASASKDGTIRVWQVFGQGNSLELRGHRDQVWSVAWSPDGSRLASASWDRTVRIWLMDDFNKAIILLGHSGEVVHIAWSPDGSRLASASSDGTVQVWSSHAFHESHVLIGHKDFVHCVAWSPDGFRLASASSDGTVRVWSAHDYQESLVLKGHERIVSHVAWSSDGSRLASASVDHTVRVWDMRDKQRSMSPLVLWGHTHHVEHVDWSRDGRLATASRDCTVRVWNVNGDAVLPTPQRQPYVQKVSWSPDGSCLATTSHDDKILLWDVTGEYLRYTVLIGHQGEVDTATWLPDGRLVSKSPEDNTVRVWDPVKAAEENCFDASSPEAETLDRKSLSYGWKNGYFRLKIIDRRTSSEGVAETQVICGPDDDYTVLAYWPEGLSLTPPPTGEPMWAAAGQGLTLYRLEDAPPLKDYSPGVEDSATLFMW